MVVVRKILGMDAQKYFALTLASLGVLFLIALIANDC